MAAKASEYSMKFMKNSRTLPNPRWLTVLLAATNLLKHSEAPAKRQRKELIDPT